VHPRPEQYRRRGILARQHSAESAEPAVKAAFEEVAVNWFALAKELEWVEDRAGRTQT
jgi:hypothetical protein